MHSYYELHYVSGGQGILITDKFEMPLSKGCFYLLPPRTNHEQWSNPLELLEEYYLAFELVSKAENDTVWESLLSNGYYDGNQNELEVYFNNIVRETSQKQYGYLDLINQNIQSIFITLIRSFKNMKSESFTISVNLDDRRNLLIDEAFLYDYKTVTLSSLSDRLKLSTRQTQRYIKANYGVSFSILKFQSKLNHAAMLLSTKLTLEEVCFQVGYKNYSFFNRAFKQQYNKTPKNYRKTHFYG
jgi:AraC-like DNA-binding protein